MPGTGNLEVRQVAGLTYLDGWLRTTNVQNLVVLRKFLRWPVAHAASVRHPPLRSAGRTQGCVRYVVGLLSPRSRLTSFVSVMFSMSLRSRLHAGAASPLPANSISVGLCVRPAPGFFVACFRASNGKNLRVVRRFRGQQIPCRGHPTRRSESATTGDRIAECGTWFFVPHGTRPVGFERAGASDRYEATPHACVLHSCETVKHISLLQQQQRSNR